MWTRFAIFTYFIVFFTRNVKIYCFSPTLKHADFRQIGTFNKSGYGILFSVIFIVFIKRETIIWWQYNIWPLSLILWYFIHSLKNQKTKSKRSLSFRWVATYAIRTNLDVKIRMEKMLFSMSRFTFGILLFSQFYILWVKFLNYWKTTKTRKTKKEMLL